MSTNILSDSSEVTPTSSYFGLPPIPSECIKKRRRRAYGLNTRANVYARDGHRCRRCGSAEGEVTRSYWFTPCLGRRELVEVRVRLVLHHVHAFSLGGCNHEHNLVALCERCNTELGVA